MLASVLKARGGATWYPALPHSGREDRAGLPRFRVWPCCVPGPGFPRSLHRAGCGIYQEGRIDDALKKVEEALRIDPTYVHARWDRTQYLFHGKRDFPAAAKAAEEFLKVVPEGPDADNVRKLMAEARQQGVKGIPLLPKAR